MRHALLSAVPLVFSLAACGDSPSAAEPARTTDEPAPPAQAEDLADTVAAEATADDAAARDTARERPWLDFRGTSVLGFGVLRLVPPAGGGRFRITYRDTPEDGYSITDNAQVFVLPGDAFAEQPMAYAGDLLAFRRTPPYDSGYVPDELRLEIELKVDEETTVLVGYGPWTGPDTGRPPGDEPTFSLDVTALDDGGQHAWLESEAGELITMNWTPRPEVERGAPTTDPVTGDDVWIEVRPLILYDASLARSSDEEPALDLGDAPSPAELRALADDHEAAGRLALAQDARERAADLAALARRRDERIVLTPELTETFRRVPIRWR